MELVDEKNDLALGLDDLVEDGLEAIFELASIFRAGDERAHVEHDDLLVLETFGHILVDDASGQAFDDGGLADAGLADEYRVVFGAPRKHLNYAADLFVASNDRIELAALRQLGEIASIFLECLVFRFGVLIGHALRAADLRQHFEDPIFRDAVLLQNSGGRRPAAFPDDCQKHMLRADEVVFQPGGFGFGRLGHLSHAGRQRGLRSAVGRRLLRQLIAQLCCNRPGLDVHLAQQGRYDSVSLLQQREQQMFGLDLRVIHIGRSLLRRNHRFLSLFRVFVQVHGCVLSGRRLAARQLGQGLVVRPLLG